MTGHCRFWPRQEWFWATVIPGQCGSPTPPTVDGAPPQTPQGEKQTDTQTRETERVLRGTGGHGTGTGRHFTEELGRQKRRAIRGVVRQGAPNLNRSWIIQPGGGAIGPALHMHTWMSALAGMLWGYPRPAGGPPGCSWGLRNQWWAGTLQAPTLSYNCLLGQEQVKGRE